jgi:sugar fermentation stimulation protein A
LVHQYNHRGRQFFPDDADYRAGFGNPSHPVSDNSWRNVCVDFLLTGGLERPIYLEAKSVTLAEGKVALFPDTVTTRGQKHLRELTTLLPQARAMMLYFVFSCDRADPVYGQLLREALALGIEVLPCRFEITPHLIRYLGLAEFLAMQPTAVSTTTGNNSYLECQ